MTNSSRSRLRTPFQSLSARATRRSSSEVEGRSHEACETQMCASSGVIPWFSSNSTTPTRTRSLRIVTPRAARCFSRSSAASPTSSTWRRRRAGAPRLMSSARATATDGGFSDTFGVWAVPGRNHHGHFAGLTRLVSLRGLSCGGRARLRGRGARRRARAPPGRAGKTSRPGRRRMDRRRRACVTSSGACRKRSPCRAATAPRRGDGVELRSGWPESGRRERPGSGQVWVNLATERPQASRASDMTWRATSRALRAPCSRTPST